ncbi:MAG: hypothetical protein Q8W45_03395 [Candidatus Palauibacterales bacterium]|nr:hypothetical protein [Candidatus Palauibacterales bacterium]
MKKVLRRLRGALGNALVWAVGWFGVGFVLLAGIYLFDGRTYWSLFLSNALSFATTMAVTGLVTGGAFSAYIAASFQEDRLEDLSPARFALGGGLVALLTALVFVVGYAAIAGVGLPLLDSLVFPLITSAALGTITGFSSLKLAQRSLLGAGSDRSLLGAGNDE